MRIWIILRDDRITDDRAYLVGALKCAFDDVMVTRASRLATEVAPPPRRPDLILNFVGTVKHELLDDIDAKAAAYGAQVSPRSDAAWRSEDKRSYLVDFADVSPPTRLLRGLDDLETTRLEMGGDVVIKDPFGFRGLGVERLRSANDLPIAEALLARTVNGEKELLIQPFFAGFAKGDKRVLAQRMPDDSYEIVAHIARVPPPGGWKSNITSGGAAQSTELSDEERDFVLRLAPRTGLDNASFDIAEHDGRLWFIEHNQGYGGIIDFDLERDTFNARKTIRFLLHLAQHGRFDVA